MTYQPGERVVLEHTNDPYTLLRPGDEGTVRGYIPHLRVVDVEWDSGSRLSMVLDTGDRIRRIAPTDTTDEGWGQVLDALRDAGAAAGRAAAQWWAQDAIGGRAHGDVRAAARAILAALDDGDPAVVDALPAADRYDDAAGRARYAEASPDGAPPWQRLPADRCDQARWAWGDGFDTAVTDEVARQCRTALHPGGDDRDLSHLHPDQVRLGGPGVFAGDWAWAPGDDGQLRVPVGFVGTLVDAWNGWAVFTCTRGVAEAIVADQQAARDRYRRDLAVRGVSGAAQDRMVDEALARMRFDGDVIHVDQTVAYGDPDAVERIAPDTQGRYVVMGRSWTWIAVHPYDCDRIVGDLPDPPGQPPTPAT
ncbi:DUF4314 domain-containing protein [Micromonospora sp. NPDC005305]|uniref:DUF4314 domain-containing protein n=1 Tax=Micromonospora sp. NPDC005305 TaxID=3156875 RepID=UPI0033B91293